MENVEYLQAPVDGKEARRVVVLNYGDLVRPNVPKNLNLRLSMLGALID